MSEMMWARVDGSTAGESFYAQMPEERRKAFISMLGPCYREWLRERAESDRGATPPRSSGPQPR